MFKRAAPLRDCLDFLTQHTLVLPRAYSQFKTFFSFHLNKAEGFDHATLEIRYANLAGVNMGNLIVVIP